MMKSVFLFVFGSFIYFPFSEVSQADDDFLDTPGSLKSPAFCDAKNIHTTKTIIGYDGDDSSRLLDRKIKKSTPVRIGDIFKKPQQKEVGLAAQHLCKSSSPHDVAFWTQLLSEHKSLSNVMYCPNKIIQSTKGIQEYRSAMLRRGWAALQSIRKY